MRRRQARLTAQSTQNQMSNAAMTMSTTIVNAQ